MKKRLILSVLILVLFLNLVLAQDTPGFEEAPLVSEIQEGQNKLEKYNQQENKSSYLLEEWGRTLEKNKFGKVIIKISDFIKNFNPLFKIILGYEYSLSWGFFFSAIIWLGLFLFLVNPASVVLKGKLFGIIGSFAITSLVGLTGVIKKAVEMLAFMLNNVWIAALSFFIAIIIVLVLEKFGKKISKQLKEESEEEKLEKSKKMIEAQGKIAEKSLDAFGENEEK